MDCWIDTCVRIADIDDMKNSQQERIEAIAFLAEITYAFSDYINKKEEIASQIMELFTRCCMEKTKLVRIVGIALMFQLLDKLIADRSQMAPALYKHIIGSIGEDAE